MKKQGKQSNEGSGKLPTKKVGNVQGGRMLGKSSEGKKNKSGKY